MRIPTFGVHVHSTCTSAHEVRPSPDDAEDVARVTVGSTSTSPPDQTVLWTSPMSPLCLISDTRANGFVKPSASISAVGVRTSVIIPRSTYSRMT